MGFVDFLKKLFSEEGKAEEGVYKLEFAELEDFVNSLAKERARFADSEIETFRGRIDSLSRGLKESIGVLENAELRNSNIPDRVKQIMEGNRENYVQRMEKFLKEVEIPSDSIEAMRFCESFSLNLKDLDQSVARGHHVMSEFFPKEAGVISNQIKELNRAIEETKIKLQSFGFDKIDRLKLKLKEIIGKTSRKNFLDNEIKSSIEKIEELKAKVEEKGKMFDKFSGGFEYDEFTGLTDKKGLAELELKKLVEVLNHYFSEVEPALKKYSNYNPENKLIKNYLKDVLKSVLEDEELEIVRIIVNVRESMASGKLELKDKKKEKIFRELEKLDMNYFKQFIGSYKKLKMEVEELDSEIKNSKVSEKYGKMKNDLDQSRKELEKLENVLEGMKKEHAMINVEDSFGFLENEIKEVFGKSVKII